MADSDEERPGRFHSERSQKSQDSISTSNKRKRDDDFPVKIPSKPKPGAMIDHSAPIVKTFKQWVNVTDDEYITPEKAENGYKDYMLKERRLHIANFFEAHKDEEWFRQLYHPEDSKIYQVERETFLRERFHAWKQLYDENLFNNLYVDLESQNKIAKILDAVIMVLEGNTVDDVVNFVNDGSGPKRPKISLLGADGKEPNLDDDDGLIDDVKSTEEQTEDGEVMETKKPIYYKSLYIKSLSPKISKADLTAACKSYEGFKQIAMEVLQVDKGKEKRFNRRAWITFDDRANIKEYSYQLNKHRIKDCEINSTPEKENDIKNRVRQVPGLSNHSSIAFRDLRLAVKICENKDKQMFAYDDKSKNNQENKKSKSDNVEDDLDSDGSDSDAGDITKNQQFWDNAVNPLYLKAMQFIQEYEDMYQERLIELLEYTPSITTRKNEETGDEEKEEDLIEIDAIEDIFNVLDPLVLYLRIVHCIDFYAQADYSSFEDEHPCRCNIFHVRGAIPSRGLSMKTAKDWVNKFNSKIEELLLKKINPELSMEQAEELGFKNENDEVERFIEDNTEMLEENKFLCPLSQKKFKGKEYVRKHILNKHGDRINGVKLNADYFNRYCRDGNKEGPPEPRYVIKGGSSRNQNYGDSGHQNGHMSNGYHRGGHQNNYNNNYNNYRGGSGGGGYHDRHQGGYNQGQGGYNQARPQGVGYVPGGRGDSGHGHYEKRPRYSNREEEHLRRASGGRGMVDYRDLDAPENMDMFG